MFKINGIQGKLLMSNCTFYNDENNEGSKIFDTITSDITFEYCTFTRPARNMILINQNRMSKGVFTFINNLVEKNKRQFILANSVTEIPIIENNVFQDIDIVSGYLMFFTLYGNDLNVELYNNTFQRITTKTESSYCSGVSNWFESIDKVEMSLKYTKCYFYDITNNNQMFPYNQGGALHYGYATSIYNVNFVLENCEFKRNRCPNGSGGAIAFNIGHDLTITDCLFKDNQAKNRGGAIYFDDRFEKTSNDIEETININSINIFNCQFNGNSANNGHAIYIAEYYSLENATLSISDCVFTDNGENKYYFVIYTDTGRVEFNSNIVQFTDIGKSSKILYASQLSSSVNLTDSNFINCSGGDLYSIETYHGLLISVLRCQFTNCISIVGGIIFCDSKYTEVISCNFTYDDSKYAGRAILIISSGLKLQNISCINANANGTIYFDQRSDEPVLFENCIFDNCVGYHGRCFVLFLYTNQITIRNIIFQNFQELGNIGYFFSICQY